MSFEKPLSRNQLTSACVLFLRCFARTLALRTHPTASTTRAVQVALPPSPTPGLVWVWVDLWGLMEPRTMRTRQEADGRRGASRGGVKCLPFLERWGQRTLLPPSLHPKGAGI